MYNKYFKRDKEKLFIINQIALLSLQLGGTYLDITCNLDIKNKGRNLYIPFHYARMESVYIFFHIGTKSVYIYVLSFTGTELEYFLLQSLCLV